MNTGSLVLISGETVDFVYVREGLEEQYTCLGCGEHFVWTRGTTDLRTVGKSLCQRCLFQGNVRLTLVCANNHTRIITSDMIFDANENGILLNKMYFCSCRAVNKRITAERMGNQ